MSGTMKAVVFDRCGGPEVLELREVPAPEPKADEAVVDVMACAVNHLDLWVRQGLRGLDAEMPHILGNDIAGVVSAVGEAVRHVKIGDKVVVLPTLSCGVCPACLAGDDNLCRQYDVIGRKRNGGYAEKVAVPGANLLPYPENLMWEEAAAVPLVFLTAWHMLVGRAKLRAGEDVLVIGAGSGVGSAAIQVARLIGARVIATAGSEAKLERAKALGAHQVVVHSGEFAKTVRDLTGGKGVEVVFEHVGGAVFEQAAGALARDGRLVTCGATTGHEAQIDLRVLFGRQLSLLGSYMGRKGELLRAAPFFFAGELRSVVDRTFPLSEAAEAHRYLESRQPFGKVVLVV